MVGKGFLLDCKDNLKVSELGNFTLVLNAQEMGAVVSGGLGSLACCSIAGQMILFVNVKDFICTVIIDRVGTDARRGGQRSSWLHLCCVSSLSRGLSWDVSCSTSASVPWRR